MAERVIDPGGGGGDESDKQKGDQPPRSGLSQRDKGGEERTQSPNSDTITVPGVSVRKEDMKEEHEECQGGKPALEQTTSQQSESNWQSVHDPTVPVPISRVEAKVKSGRNVGISEKKGGGTAGISQEKGHATAGGSKEKGSGTAGISQEKGHGTAGSSKEKGSGTAGSSKEKGSGTAGSSKEKGSGTAGSSKEKGSGTTGSSQAKGGGSRQSMQSSTPEEFVVVKLHAFIQPGAWNIDAKDQIFVEVHSQYLNWDKNCAEVKLTKCNELTQAVEAQLRLPKGWMNRELQYKFYVHAGKDASKNYEHITHKLGDEGNRCLIPNKSYRYDPRDRCYHHYDDFIVPKSGWFMTTWKKDTGQKDANELKATSMKQYLQCYSDAFDSPPNLRRMLCQDVSAAIEDISSKFTHLKDGYSCPVHSYGYSHPEPLNESSCSRLKSEFKEWMGSIIHSLHGLVRKTSSTTETVELQLAGCVLVAVLSNVGMWEFRGVQNILIELMYVLKLPSTNPAFVQEWCTKLRMCFTTNRSPLVFKGLQQFWYHMARKDRMQFDILLLLCEVNESQSLDMFQVAGCRRSTLTNIVTTAIASFKESLAEFSKLFESFPAFGTFVLEISPLQQWYALNMAYHIPADQCLIALSAKVNGMKKADQVKAIGQFSHSLLLKTNGLQSCSFVESQMKKLLTSWHSFTGFALRSFSVDMDMKVVILNMCFCLNGIAKISAAEIETALRLLCEDVKTGIKNAILSVSSSRKMDVLGLGLEFKLELHVWNSMLSEVMFVTATMCQGAWTKICCQAIKQRVDRLKLKDKLDSLIQLQDIPNHLELLEKVLLDSAMETFSALTDHDREQYFHGQLNHQMQHILKKFLTNKYPDIDKINFEELCTWSPWPQYFFLFRGKDDSRPEHMTTEGAAYVQAAQVLNSVVTSIVSGEVNVECINIITCNRKNFEALVKCNYEQTNAKAGVDCDDILQRTQKLASEIVQFEDTRLKLLFLCERCSLILVTDTGRDELFLVQELCKRNIHSCPVAKLQEEFSDYAVVQRLYPILNNFYTVFKTFQSDITKKIWTQVCCHNVTSLQDLAEKVWPAFIAKLQIMVLNMSQLKVPCGEAENLMPTGTAPQQLQMVVKALKACAMPVAVVINVDEISSKVRLYGGLQAVAKEARQLLCVIRNFELEGDFTRLLNIANIPSRLADQPISVLDEQYEEVVVFLHGYSSVHASLEELSISHELVDWLKKAMKDVNQLQTFTHIALMTQCTDGSSVDLLTSLDQVGVKLAPLIFDLQRHGGLKSFMECCCPLRSEHLSGIPEKVQICRDKLNWYKTIQSTLGSVEESAFGQLEDITKHGKYIIHVGQGIPKDIRGLVKVQVLKQHSAKCEYTLDELKDLQRKLALIKGKMTETDIKDMADRFWQGLELTVRIASTLQDLVLMGHVKYRKFESKYSLHSVGIIDQLQESAKQMESDLDEWRTNIEKLRSKYYHMNYFTTRQLSLICQELSSSYTITHHSLNPWFINLLQSVCPTIDTHRLATAAVMVAEERERAKKSTLFGFGSRDNSLPLEEVTGDEEPQDAMRKDDLESFERRYTQQALKVDDLNETQQEWFQELCELDFSEELVLIALTKTGCSFDDVYDYCLNFSMDVEPVVEKASGVDSEVTAQEAQLAELALNENHPLVRDMIEAGFDLELAIEAAEVCNCNSEQMFDYCLEKGVASANEVNKKESEDEIEVPLALPLTVDIATEDLWSLENVGQFLQYVAEQHAEDIQCFLPSARSFPHFERGAPNLVVVPRDELLRTVLSLYMPTEDLPLPTLEEVLFCDSKTTSEEIRLLWRRAVCDPEFRRIFCLVCEHNMSYKLAKEAVQDLRELMQGKREFKLLIICCKEDEGSSLLVGDLREYKQNPPLLPVMKDIQQYLRSHFAADVVKFGPDLPILGAAVDTDQSYVRVVTSARAGMGKSLYISRKIAELDCQLKSSKWLQSATLHGPELSKDSVVKVVQNVSAKDTDNLPFIYQVGVSDRVVNDIGSILFSMMILRGLQDSEGNIWRCRLKNLYLIEVNVSDTGLSSAKCNNSIDLIRLLPMTRCLSPYECLGGQSPTTDEVVTMDEKERLSEPYQRVFQYLYRYQHKISVDEFTYCSMYSEGDETDCILLLLQLFELKDPSWAELDYFVQFLNTQLMACEHFVYCNEAAISDRSQGKYGFKSFVKFMIRMAVDFTVPSLKSEHMNQEKMRRNDSQEPDIEGYQVVQRRAWENNVHPYIFLNRDTSSGGEVYYDSMTFVGFNFQQVSKIVNLIDLQLETIEENIMTDGLYRWMHESGVEFHQDPKTWTKVVILKKLYRVLESSTTLEPDDFSFELIDPDRSYALTYDNLVKMLAIQMRFRCGIPVVIMGETGCGKTRLVRYMCQLQARLKMDSSAISTEPLQNFFIMKIHRGVTEEEITHFVREVQVVAAKNQKIGLDTVLFFDEANTSDAIELIKEIMCDRRLNGESIPEDIKFIAACNPYKRHSDDMIEKLESTGLGFFIKGEKTKQKLGSTPLRHLVYRVLDLPASMKPLVYDYGSLGTATEQTYIHRIVENHVGMNQELRGIHNLTEALTRVLSWCQDYMRNRKDECSYVSLRDVERYMIVFEWFHKMYKVIADEMTQVNTSEEAIPDPCTLATILSLAVCYYTWLLDRADFEAQLVQQAVLVAPLQLPNGGETFYDVVQCCQEAFLENMELGDNIAHNAALRENVFMMTVCVELRIPLFVVGKPGSSKSLAKSIIAESMKGQKSKKDFLKNFKSVKLFSYQCSQLSTPESIIDVFRSAKQIQDGLDYRTDVALVVLGDVGLAENSPSFPLKALHPLLEDGTDGSDHREQIVAREERVAFIGVSNWALDPAKMNRGIMVMRGEPSIDELVNSARGICSNEEDDPVRAVLDPLLEELAESYLTIVSEQAGNRKEFFGLRDFYSLIKMLYWLIRNSGGPYKLTEEQLQHSILRNFGGTKQIDPLRLFAACMNNRNVVKSGQRMDCSPLGLIQASLSSEDISWHGENRYLLFLTGNDAALEIMQNYLFQGDVKPYVLFGSSFPQDKDYTQVCRNINQIKICMETGRTVVLLNLENLYESLYDLLNQYYTKFLGSRYVDLGLQSHRIKCRVDEKFKLILIADMDKVYEKFPIPLINRLEKHIVTTSIILQPEQRRILSQLLDWLSSFCTVPSRSFKDGDAFIGYQSETAAAVVLHASRMVPRGHDDLLNTCKKLLIQMACPDALARLKETALKQDAEKIWEMYFSEQDHLCLSRLIRRQLQSPLVTKDAMGLLIQVTTHSLPLSPTHVKLLCSELKIDRQRLLHLYIEEMDTEADFTDRIRKHMSTVTEGDTYILVQCSSGHLNKDLISCARHKAIDELENFRGKEEWKEEYVAKGRQVHVIFIVSLPKTPGGTTFAAFQGGRWLCVHLDDLRSPEATALTFMAAVKFPLSKLFSGLGGIALHKRLQGCLQAAIAQIPEVQTQDRSHKTEVLKIMHKALGDGKDVSSGENTFYSHLVLKITPLLQELEQSQTDVLGKGWAVTEALDPHKLQEGGTFLNTLLRRIDGILTDLLAYIIEFIDQHNNLALFHDDQLQGLWLDMFHDDRICAFSYRSLHQSAEESKTKSLVQKLGSVSVGRYSCKLPFSWIVVQAVEAQWSHSNLESDCDACQCLKSLYGKIEVQHIGAFFRDYPVESAPSLQLHLLYLKDFVASVLQSHSVEEAEVLETILMYISDQMLQSTDEVTLLHRLVSYHVAYHLNEVHFAQYRVLGSIFPDLHGLVVDQLAHQLQGTAPAASSTFIAEPLDLLAVRLLLERIAPKPLSKQAKVEFWNIKNLRNVYIKKLRECQTTVDGILQYSPCNSVQTSLRVRWHSVRAVQMYIEHLILPLSSNEKMNEEITKGAFRLWSALTRPGKAATFSRKEQLERFIDILRSVDDRVAAHFGFSSPEDRQDAVQMGTVTSSSEASYGDFCRAVKMLFLEVVSVLCFGQGSYESPTPELIELLMKQVFQNQATQDLTPLAWEESDSSPVIRSVLLQLILMGSEMEVDLSRLIESFISTCSRYLPVESQPKLLYSLVIRCLEDTAYKAQFMGQDRKDIACSLEKLGNLLESSIQSYARHDPEAPPTFKWLNDIAQLRIALALSADYLCMYVAETPEKRTLKQRSQMMLEQFVALLSACLQRPQLQDLSLYLAKQIARRHGMIMLKRLNQEYSFVLPLSLQQHQMQHRVPDLLVLSGDGYSEVREAIMQAIVDESDQSFRDTLSHLPAACALCIPLAVFAKLTWPTQSILKTPDEKLLEDISSSIQQCGSLDHSLTELSLNLLRREVGRGFTQMQPSQDMHARMLTTLVLHVVTAVFSKQRDPLLKPFVSILTAPATMAGKYLPTMPEDFLVQAMTLMDMAGQYRQHAHMRGRFYSCPNGHPYIITECTGPNQSWNCPECHQRIGAHNSQLAQGNRTTPMASRTEVGYILGDTRNRSQEAIPERNLSPLACAVMRFILHACFMWSACHQPEAVSQSIIAVAVGDVATFFWEHLLMDMRVLGRAMSSAEDEVALYLHQIIASISSRQDVTSIDGSLASKAIRNNWEDHFCRQILDPWLQNPAAVIQNGLDVISKDAELDHDEVFLAVYEKTGREPNMMQTLWAFRTRITLQDLTSTLNNVPDVKHKYPLLHKFLQEEPLLRALQYLPSIVQLQRVLVACFNHKIDRGEAQALTIRMCFNQVTNSEEERVSLVECLAGFRKAWELVKERLAHHRIRITAPDVQTMGDVSEDLPVAYILPCVSGPGLCSLALADFLLFQQNELIEHCAQSLSRYSCFSRKSIPLSQVQPFHMVSYEGEIDSVILTHCRYSLIFGKGQEVEYDFAALEKHIYDRFLVTKPEIDGSSQPLMMYTSDIIRQDIFQQLRDKIKPQIVLSPEEKWEVLDRLHNNLRHITEALSIVTTAMGFLASAGSCPDMPCAMKDYILKVLKIRKTEFCANCTLQHILSLWETLALEKARMHSLNGKEIPFDGYNDATRELFHSMPEEAEKAYKRSLKGIPLDSLMSLLFQFVQVRLRTFQPQEFQWPLKDCLQSYSPDCYDSNIQDLEERLNDFPEDVLVEHAVHMWHITVRHHHDLLQSSSSVRY